MWGAMSAAGISASRGIGFATSCPPGRPRRARIRWARAMAAGSSRRSGAARPLSRDQNAGRASWPTAITGTPRVSSTSRVLGRSRIALAPLATTVTGVRASSSRSAEMSKLASAPRCTPPMPPVANTSMPARRAQIIVAATVVAPVHPALSATARSARESLRTSGAAASASRRSGSRPTWMRPSITAMVAGTAPAARMSASTARAVSTFVGRGMPWVMMVDSRATSGRRAAKASATSVAKARGGAVMGPRMRRGGRRRRGRGQARPAGRGRRRARRDEPRRTRHRRR